MRVELIEEPEICFGRGGTHIDVRAGLVTYGPFDLDADSVPRPIQVGIIGTTNTVDKLRDWLEASREPVYSGESKRPKLRPDFPGLNLESFGTYLSISDRNTRTVTRHELRKALKSKTPIEAAAELFYSHAKDLTGRGKLNVLVIAPPMEVFDLVKPEPKSEGLDDGQDTSYQYKRNFHDTFKAKALNLGVACQLTRPDTYGGKVQKTNQRKRSLQNPAIRAWNFNMALYYKAGGTPWRLPAKGSDFATCYMGVSFYKNLTGSEMMTSLAQVFDERGDGLVVRGGNAKLDSRDKSPHLLQEDATKLLGEGLAAYRREHRNAPARLVVNKTSYFNEEEIEGFLEAADDERIEYVDLVSIRPSSLRLLPYGDKPAARGLCCMLDSDTSALYLSGFVPYHDVYSGPYIPRPLEVSRDFGESSILELSKDILKLSKLNFNNTALECGEPVTIRAAKKVGDILKNVTSTNLVESQFRFFT